MRHMKINHDNYNNNVDTSKLFELCFVLELEAAKYHALRSTNKPSDILFYFKLLNNHFTKKASWLEGEIFVLKMASLILNKNHIFEAKMRIFGSKIRYLSEPSNFCFFFQTLHAFYNVHSPIMHRDSWVERVFINFTWPCSQLNDHNYYWKYKSSVERRLDSWARVLCLIIHMIEVMLYIYNGKHQIYIFMYFFLVMDTD